MTPAAEARKQLEQSSSYQIQLVLFELRVRKAIEDGHSYFYVDRNEFSEIRDVIKAHGYTINVRQIGRNMFKHLIEF